ncbi:hypothetical protein [Mastigocoleus testarum]|uniref:Uncharacterized protein n=1 Tax=Mastigocoleus testarum BC008 TaxID=371196 RepID=A0A0V7ZN52_9CYAN|nr:hypothetical protein [Mastigocoleus testarum]KST65961.1 hypothetical protein BC008_23580 [Mastigocoleus testarum BC008]
MLDSKPINLHFLKVFGLSLPIVVASIIGVSQSAYACLPDLGTEPSTLEQRVKRTPILFEGVVNKVSEEVLIIQVNQYFKGNGPKVVRLRGFNSTSCDDFIDKPGGRFLFFAEKKDNRAWKAVYDGAFGSVRAWNSQTEAELRKLK